MFDKKELEKLRKEEYANAAARFGILANAKSGKLLRIILSSPEKYEMADMGVDPRRFFPTQNDIEDKKPSPSDDLSTGPSLS